MNVPPVRLVSQQHLRQLFNDGRYHERTLSGDLTAKRRKTHSPKSPDEPPGTVAVTEEYYDPAGIKVAVVHFDERPDGSIGASGLVDPKCVLIDGTLYVCEVKKSRP